MVSKFQWKPFWLATQRDPQNDWAATQNRVNYDVFAQAPFQKSRLLVLREKKKIIFQFSSMVCYNVLCISMKQYRFLSPKKECLTCSHTVLSQSLVKWGKRGMFFFSVWNLEGHDQSRSLQTIDKQIWPWNIMCTGEEPVHVRLTLHKMQPNFAGVVCAKPCPRFHWHQAAGASSGIDRQCHNDRKVHLTLYFAFLLVFLQVNPQQHAIVGTLEIYMLMQFTCMRIDFLMRAKVGNCDLLQVNEVCA